MWKSGDSSITYNAIEEDFNRMINWYTDRRLTIPEWLIDDYKEFLKGKVKVKKQGEYGKIEMIKKKNGGALKW